MFGFVPDVEGNQILFGLKGMLNVGDDIITEIINGRPYKSPKDFYCRIHPKKQAMISLIKGGAFDSMMDRKLCMAWYLWEVCDKKSDLNLRNMEGLIRLQLLPENTKKETAARRVYEFNRYLKYLKKLNESFTLGYLLDERAINFLVEFECNDLIETSEDGKYYIGVKNWEKIYNGWMDIFRAWISANKNNLLEIINKTAFKESWDKYAEKGNISAWEMKTLCFYYHSHELANVDTKYYGISDFNYLPEEPIIDYTFKKSGKEIPIYKLTRIFGTCIAKNKDRATVTLLTPTGVVTVKFRKEYFSLFDKQVSVKGPDGKKKIVEKSWFERGNMIVVTGIRSGDNFIVKKYAATPGHQLYKITDVTNNGTRIEITSERYKGDLEDEE